jgi:ABC-type glutathione transport system ATPase component
MTLFTEPLMQIRGLGKRHAQRRPFSRGRAAVCAFDDVNLAIRRCSTVAIVGESGAGKSSLARCLALLDQPSRGEISWEGRIISGLSKKELFPLRRQIQLISQDPCSSLNPRLTAAQIVAGPLRMYREGTPAQRYERAITLMKQVGLPPDHAQKRPAEFGSGQLQRLAIARALALEPKLLILDEVLSSLDAANQEMILSLLVDLQATRALTCLHISHDLQLVSRFAAEIAVMHQGRIVEQQSARALFACPMNSYTQDLVEEIPAIEAILDEHPEEQLA